MPSSIAIHPNALDETTAPLLESLVDEETGVTLYERDEIYPLAIKTQIHDLTLPLELKNTILKRPSNKDACLTRWEVFGRYLNAAVLESLGVIKPEKNFTFYPRTREKSRIIKLFTFSPEANEREVIAYLIEQCDRTNECSDFLRCSFSYYKKGDTLIGFLIMRQAIGRELFDYINDLREQGKHNDYPQLIKISLAIIKPILALHKKQWVHHDLTSKNMVYNPENNSIQLLDFEVAQKLPCPPLPEYNGTMGFIAPELLTDKLVSPANDWFSVGWILAELWGYHTLNQLIRRLNLFVKDPEKMAEHLLVFYKKDHFEHLFKNRPEIPAEVAQTITCILNGFTRYAPEERMMGEKAFYLINDLDESLTMENTPSPNL